MMRPLSYFRFRVALFICPQLGALISDTGYDDLDLARKFAPSRRLRAIAKPSPHQSPSAPILPLTDVLAAKKREKAILNGGAQ
jgi:hypothetical protein